MPRLTAKQWERARAEYEVRGIGLRETARTFGVSVGAVAKKAKAEGWKQGKSEQLVSRKVHALKELAKVNTESEHLPSTFQRTLDQVVKERLEIEGLLISFDKSLVSKGMEILKAADKPEQWETMTRGRRNLSPPQPRAEQQTTVNVTQQTSALAASAAVNPQSEGLCMDSLRAALRNDLAGEN